MSLPKKTNVMTMVKINIITGEHSHLLSRPDLRIRYSCSSSLLINLSFIMPLKCYFIFAKVIYLEANKGNTYKILLKKTSRITDFISIS